MSAARSRPSAKSVRASATTAAKGAAKGAARAAAKGAGSSAAKGAAKAVASKAVAAGGDRIGRGTRWTEEQVALLLSTVSTSATAKEAFESVAAQLGKSAGTVQQKYYNLQKGSGGTTRRAGRPRGAASAGSGSAAGRGVVLPTAAQLRGLDVDALVGLATLVKGEVDRRRMELDSAARQLAELAG